MRDVEVLLRGFAMLVDGQAYKSSMAQFLNQFSKSAKAFAGDRVDHLESLALSFLSATLGLREGAFLGKSGKFMVTLFEAVFAAACGGALGSASATVAPLEDGHLDRLKADEPFVRFSQAQSNKKANVDGRLARARAVLLGE